MSLLVDDTAPEWVFSSPDNRNLSMQEAGWHQLANDPSANTEGYYNGTALWTTTPGAIASLLFQGTEVFLYATKSPLGGNMNITCDWNSSIISLNQSEMQPGLPVWHAAGLDAGVMHAVRVQMVDKGRINIDSLGVTPGAESPIPARIPSPLPPAFLDIIPSASKVVATDTLIMATTLTMTMTMTITASASSLQTKSSNSLTNGALAGVIAGAIALVLLIIGCTLACWRKRRRRRNSFNAQRGTRFSGLRRLILGRPPSQSPSSSGPSFMQIQDRDEEKGAGGALEEEHGKASGILPSIRRLSTLTLGASIFRTSPAASQKSTSQIHPLPLRRPNSPLLRTHRRGGHSLAVTLSIDTNCISTSDKFVVGTIRTSKVGSFSRGDDMHSIHTGRRTPGGFSTSDGTDNLQDFELEKDNSEMNGALFYSKYHTEHFFDTQSERHEFEEGLMEEEGSVRERYTDEPDTPLLPNSPAVASSNVSISHHSSALSHGSRPSKGNKILRSLHSHSSKRSSFRQSFGKLSRQSSFVRTPNARTPVSRKSNSTGILDSPRNDRGNRTSTTSVLNPPPLTTEPSSVHIPPLVLSEGSMSSPTLGNPSSCDTSLVAPPRKAVRELTRAHRPVGPRARSSSNVSLTSQTISSEGSSHSRNPSNNENGDMLSIVEEVSRSGSMRTFLDNYDNRT